MKLPNELCSKFRINNIFYNNDIILRANAFDFSNNRTVLLTILKNIDLTMFNIVKSNFYSKNNGEHFEFILDTYTVDYINSINGLFYTQELGEPLFSLDTEKFIDKTSTVNWFYKLALPSFYSFINNLKEKDIHHGLISPFTVYYCDDKIKIGDCIFGALISINPQIIYDLPLFNQSYFSSKFSDSDLDTYSLIKILINASDNPSDVFKTNNTCFDDSDFANVVKDAIKIISKESNDLTSKYLFEMRPIINNYNLLLEETILYKPKQLPLLYDMVSSWNLDDYRDIVVLHINHYLEDILEMNKLLASVFYQLVYVVVPYSIKTKICFSKLYSTYYHEKRDAKYVIKKDNKDIFEADDFYLAMYKSIEIAIKNEIIQAVNKGKKVLIIEDGGFHYSIINHVIKENPQLKNSIIGAIEQTTSGVKRYLDAKNIHNIPYPVLSVARSKIKMRLEAHFIARRVVDELNYLLYMTNSFLSFHNVLIIGYGVIGRNIANALSNLKCQISVYDTNNDILSLAKNEGIDVFYRAEDIEFQENLIVIGATGETAFTSSMFFSFVIGPAKKIYLASASSKRIEFQSIIDFFEMGSKDDAYKQVIQKIDNISVEQNEFGTTYSFSFNGINKSIILIANGYPVNFYRENIISLTECVIDLIYCEMFLLIEYLLREKNNLSQRIYLLGSSDLNFLDKKEERLVRSWFELLSIKIDENMQTIWDEFDIHPFENELRESNIN